MATLDDLKKRIASVKSTQKITKAMKQRIGLIRDNATTNFDERLNRVDDRLKRKLQVYRKRVTDLQQNFSSQQFVMKQKEKIFEKSVTKIFILHA